MQSPPHSTAGGAPPAAFIDSSFPGAAQAAPVPSARIHKSWRSLAGASCPITCGPLCLTAWTSGRGARRPVPVRKCGEVLQPSGIEARGKCGVPAAAAATCPSCAAEGPS